MLMVTDLLADCLRGEVARQLAGLPLDVDAAQLPRIRRVFIEAGLAAARDRSTAASWVQFNLAPEPERQPPVYDWLNAVARELLAAGRARNFFFMHKEPGLRVRFEASDGEVGALRAELERRFAERGGWRLSPLGVVYEPEQYLFGGHASMGHVHRLFTVDSLAWLDHYARRPGPRGEAAAWRVSLLLLREVISGLGVVGWEHRGVWEAVREDTGRRLPDGAHGEEAGGGERAGWQRAVEGIRLFWERSGEEMLASFPGEERESLAERAVAVGEAARQWRTGYFESGTATTGPRRAAAFAVIFHWNRARMSYARQCLLAEALAGDEGAR
ncbi:thiopeptide-type bacteriocin biosynthesis protein [Streptomyces sp. NPDC056149]|uniref:thiopeptide-type bacteriocin biosynthesis protein n=1 Tax=Streptomyces sp. NPDC056149 TaxID=3345728 RepID=UPI0035D53C67